MKLLQSFDESKAEGLMKEISQPPKFKGKPIDGVFPNKKLFLNLLHSLIEIKDYGKVSFDNAIRTRMVKSHKKSQKGLLELKKRII